MSNVILKLFRIQFFILNAFQETADIIIIPELNGMFISTFLMNININQIITAQFCACHVKNIIL